MSANSEPVHSVDTPNMLKCDTLVDFWIRWGWDQSIRVGQGRLDEGLFLEWKDSDAQNIHAMSLTTGDGTTGEWRFSSNAGQVDEDKGHWYRTGADIMTLD